MGVPPSRLFEGRKMMWDGAQYESEEEARKVAESYVAQRFEVEVIEHEGRFVVYSRRVVKEVKVEGA